ncbi:sensor histidine kinase [Lactonifactor sp. BIOML-A3]|uniref:sensor histidine kinase n=1 Tax=unclassified Lactonifactor TaxID=2636670 RepID=UPI0012AFBF80|nr:MULTISPECIES: sensor histidine kinase [unclassified Lactonifactor]MSA03143.1 sensor histidine kinase [Lactonifactor sp. BIOML-A5]MSA09376.1 sensor histidine kinase [Lactonifactor sp. BIOML-A4]MSA14014.1 sensor histidine kinase [Lactonifactor sp. BIOML-A3]MSA17279.1 sensor histidine kinase [Lactonifactor sp. BIOML-A2]MSA37176.1 sensor histidine kinase [Lactonifactor sp. BIOML-A1]
MAVILLIMAALFLGVLWLRAQSRYRNQTEQLRTLTRELAEYGSNAKQEQILLFSDEKAIQELLIQVNLFLEHLSDLEQMQRQYEEQSRKMLANISHDLKTPLTVIYGYSEMILSSRENMESGTYEKIEKIHRKTKDVLYMINEFFDLAKLEAGDIALEHIRLDICEICRNEIINYYDSLNRPGFRTDIQIPEAPLYIEGDKQALQRILNNLLQNAMKYGADGGYLGLCVRESHGFVLIEVSDKGKGIVEENQNQVFERLVTLEDSRNKKYHGSGLGLTITKRLTEAMMGRIRLESRPFVKTIFTVEFPLERGDGNCKIPNRKM